MAHRFENGTESKSLHLSQLPLKLLSKILEYCDAPALLACSRVDLTFKLLSSLILKQRQLLLLKFTTFSPTNGPLNLLNCCLENSLKLGFLSQFPVIHFHLQLKSIAKCDIQKFLQIFGKFLRSLSIELSHPNELSTLRQLLQETPQLEQLEIFAYSQPQRPFKETLFPPSFELAALKRVSLKGTNHIDRIGIDILKAAVNLLDFQNFGYFQGSNIESFVLSNRLETVKEATLRFNRINLDFYESFAATKPKLHSLKLLLQDSFLSLDRNLGEPVGGIITRVLESSQESLLKFEIQPCRSLCGVVFPVCNKVKVLSLQYVDEPHNWLPSLCLGFPNVKDLKVRGIVNLPMVAVEIFKGWKNLECLDLDVRVTSQFNLYPNVDVAFTGFSAETCIKLASLKNSDNVSFTGMLRSQVSILELKDLRRLHISFKAVAQRDDQVWTITLVTRLSQIYAFRLLPNLKVTVGLGNEWRRQSRWRRHTTLKTIAPFVDSIENK